MKVLVTGATGFVGKVLVEKLFEKGHEVNILTTRDNIESGFFTVPVSIFKWNIGKGHLDVESLDGVEAIYHIAGDNIADGRWSEEKKELIRTSRIDSFKLILNEIEKRKLPIRKVISSSAIGIYGDRAEEQLTEESCLGDDYLSNVCKDWELIVNQLQKFDIKTVSMRTGIVLEKNGGALSKMLFPFKIGVGGILGDGEQYMSWVHRDELVNMYLWALDNEDSNGAYNAVSQIPVTNYEFTKSLGSALSRPTIFPVPAFVLKILFGEMSSILLGSQRVIPQKLIEQGYEFLYTDLNDVFSDILNNDKSPEANKKARV